MTIPLAPKPAPRAQPAQTLGHARAPLGLIVLASIAFVAALLPAAVAAVLAVNGQL